MGKIHDALRRAEEQRGRLGGPSARSVATEGLLARASAPTPAEAPRQAEQSRAQLGAPLAEEYRTLRARLQSLRRSRPLQTLVITSARAGEGKTTTALNLALSFGLEDESNTCLVDADLRTPQLQHGFPQAPDAGLAEVLRGEAKLDDALVKLPSSRLSVLSVKLLPERPSELLASRRMAELLQELAARFDTVVVDAPPVLGLPDAVTLVDLCDAALLVVGAGQASREEVESALGAVARDKVIGTVFNRCDPHAQPYYAGSVYRRG